MGSIRRWLMRRVNRVLLRYPREALVDLMPRHAVCAEIGVWKGDFSRIILERTDPRRLHLIDPWAFQPQFSDRMYGGTVAQSQTDMDRIYEAVKRDLGGRQDVLLHRESSEAALSSFEDGYFDWVYIDGNHEYEFVRRDLELAFAKVRAGGFITGDDYLWGEDQGFPVRRAVRELVNARSLRKVRILRTQYLLQKSR